MALFRNTNIFEMKRDAKKKCINSMYPKITRAEFGAKMFVRARDTAARWGNPLHSYVHVTALPDIG